MIFHIIYSQESHLSSTLQKRNAIDLGALKAPTSIEKTTSSIDHRISGQPCNPIDCADTRS